MESWAAEEHAEAIPLAVVAAVMMYATHDSSPHARADRVSAARRLCRRAEVSEADYLVIHLFLRLEPNGIPRIPAPVGVLETHALVACSVLRRFECESLSFSSRQGFGGRVALHLFESSEQIRDAHRCGLVALANSSRRSKESTKGVV